jgi:hypothetical protein
MMGYGCSLPQCLNPREYNGYNMQLSVDFKAIKSKNEPNAIATANVVIDKTFSIMGIKIYETARNRQGLYIRYPNNFNIISARARIVFDEYILEKFSNFPLFIDSAPEDSRMKQAILKILKELADEPNN